MANHITALFDKAAQWTSKQSGHAHTFALAILVVVVWAVSGPLFQFSDTWQLVINTGTTIVTFLMVFLIQNTQNRDTEALQLKIDELIRVTEQARNRLINLEDLTEEELDRVKSELTEAAEGEPGGMNGRDMVEKVGGEFSRRATDDDRLHQDRRNDCGALTRRRHASLN